jgi:ATP-dependent Lon protease
VINLAARFAVVPVRDSIVFPGSSSPLLIGRDSSVRALEFTREKDEQFVLLLLQHNLELESITSASELHNIGIVVQVHNVVYMPNGFVKTLVDGVVVVKALDLKIEDGCWMANVEPCTYEIPDEVTALKLKEEALATFRRYTETVRDIPPEFLQNLVTIENPLDVVNSITPFVRGSLPEKQRLLESASLDESVGLVCTLMNGVAEMQQLHTRVEQDVRHRMQQNQREWFINEQIRVLQEELESPELSSPDLAAIDKRIREKSLPPLVEEKVREEFARMPNLHPSTPEYSVVRNYIDTILALPFGQYTPDELNLDKVRKELDLHHYGLEKVKERILEHVAVLKLATDEKRTPILCLAGPPGVGKTSLAKSIATAMGRNYVRITLGGIRDEAEIRGHRRTYIGSMPGRIVQALRKAKSMNPVILLDEMDKMSSDFRGDPASALLEVLDPEQNREFQDHYLEVGIDLSRVLFIATANMAERIPGPLQDRMETVTLSGYHRHEKHEIVRRHLLAKVGVRNGVQIPKQLVVADDTLDGILDEYTREAGVRELERQLDHLARKRALEIVSKTKFKPAIGPKDLQKYLGVAPFHRNRLPTKVTPGVVTGLAYTSVGGEILQLECALLSGRGRMELTGKLGEVMKESAHIALTLVRQRAKLFDVDPDIFRKTDIHIHIPEGAVPKDGPSAGIALTLVLLSAFTRQAIAPDIAFTGEVSLTGRIHAIGGLTEKTIAALQSGVKTVHLPADNDRQISELPKVVREGLVIKKHQHIDEIIKLLFVRPAKKKEISTPVKPAKPKT